MNIEEQVVSSAARGDWCDFDQLMADDPDLDLDRTIGAELLHELCVAADTHPRGVRIRGAHIVGALTFDWETLKVPLILESCVFDQPISCDRAHTKSLAFVECAVPALSAERITAHGDLDFSASLFSETLSLRGADIHGDLRLASATLEGAPALDASLLTVRGQAVLSRLAANGPVVLRGARILGEALLDQVRLSAADSALDAEHMSVGGELAVTASRIDGGVSLSGAKLGALDLRHTTCAGSRGVAVRADGASIAGRVTLDGVLIEGRLSFDGATLGEVRGHEPRLAGLTALGATVIADIALTEARFDGDVILVGATVHGGLVLQEAGDTGHAEWTVDVSEASIGRPGFTGSTTFTNTANPAQPTKPAERTATAELALPRARQPAATASSLESPGHPAPGAQPLRQLVAWSHGLGALVLLAAAAAVPARSGTLTWPVAAVAAVAIAAAAALVFAGRQVVRRSEPSPESGSAVSPAGSRAAVSTASAAPPTSTAGLLEELGRTLGDRRRVGGWRNYDGYLSLRLRAGDRPVVPGPGGAFTVPAGVPIELDVIVGPRPAEEAHADRVRVDGGVDAVVVDFTFAVSVEGVDEFPGWEDIMSVSPGGAARQATRSLRAPRRAGTYPIVAELLQENRVVHVLRGALRVLPTGPEPA